MPWGFISSMIKAQANGYGQKSCFTDRFRTFQVFGSEVDRTITNKKLDVSLPLVEYVWCYF